MNNSTVVYGRGNNAEPVKSLGNKEVSVAPVVPVAPKDAASGSISINIPEMPETPKPVDIHIPVPSRNIKKKRYY